MFRLRSITLAAVSAFIATVTAAGCGSNGDSGFPDKDGDGKPDNDGTSGPGGDVTNGAGDAGLGGGADPGNVGNVSNCASQTATSTLVKVNLITMVDKSGSMGDEDHAGDYPLRWEPVASGMGAFFSDAQSAGMNATLQYFPRGDQNGSICNVGVYSGTAVGNTGLPSNRFAQSLDNTKPSGNTPTVPSLQGALNLAIATQNEPARKAKGEKAVVLYVTDGEPNGCDSTVDEAARVAAEAYNGKDKIRTYVVGVGPSTDPATSGTFNKVAKSGGTNQAIYIKVGDPEQTSKDLVAELKKIRGANLSCSFAIPTPPGGGQINYDAVRVNFTNGKNQASTLPYSEACTGGNGWHYDNKATPKQIVLCGNTCSTIQNDPGGRINIAFDCKGQQADGGSGGVH